MTAAPPPDTLLGLGGLTPEELQRLTARLGVRDENDLAAACRTNRLRDDPAFGPERQASLRRTLLTTPWRTPRRHLADARAAASRLLSSLQNHESAVRLAPVGGVRRMEPWVEGIELLASAHEPEALVEAFIGLGPIETVVEREAARARARLADGTRVSLTVLAEDPGPYIAALIERTGPATHVAALQARARARGLTLDGRGLLDANGPLPLAWEPDVYAALELDPVPPELRHLDGAPSPPATLVEMRDVVGLAHMHTDRGAGSAPLEGCARAALQNGFGWLLVADRGLDPDALEAQRAAAAGVHEDEDVPVRVLVGAEVAVGPDGQLAADPVVLEGADVVIASVEGAREADPLPRYLAAVRHPAVRVLAHPRSPTLGGPATAPDWEAVLDALAETGTALEISGESARVELEPGLLRAAIDRGVKLLPAADAHDLGSVDRAIVAVGQARRAGARVSDVLTTLTADAFREWARR